MRFCSLSLSSISSAVCARASKIILPSCVTYGKSNEKMCPSFLQVIAAEGEQKASRALREASEVIADTPSALQLRYLQVRSVTEWNKQRARAFYGDISDFDAFTFLSFPIFPPRHRIVALVDEFHGRTRTGLRDCQIKSTSPRFVFSAR